MLFYPATLPLSSKTLNYTAGVIRRHRRAIGSPPRRRQMTEMTTMHAADHHTAKHNGTWLYRGAGRSG
jgi:hypothetical protein